MKVLRDIEFMDAHLRQPSFGTQAHKHPEEEFPLCTPTNDAFGDLGPELLAEAEPLLRQFVRIKGIGQLHQDFAHVRQRLPKLALKVTLDSLRFNGLRRCRRTHPFVRVHCRAVCPEQSSVNDGNEDLQTCRADRQGLRPPLCDYGFATLA
jgi:hypothetical protein